MDCGGSTCQGLLWNMIVLARCFSRLSVIAYQPTAPHIEISDFALCCVAVILRRFSLSRCCDSLNMWNGRGTSITMSVYLIVQNSPHELRLQPVAHILVYAVINIAVFITHFTGRQVRLSSLRSAAQRFSLLRGRPLLRLK